MQVGRCERMVVIAGDDASGDALLPWIGNGFRALGAASIASEPSEAALPFDARRNGMLVGAGGIGMVLETEVSRARLNLSLFTPICLFYLLFGKGWPNAQCNGYRKSFRRFCFLVFGDVGFFGDCVSSFSAMLEFSEFSDRCGRTPPLEAGVRLIVGVLALPLVMSALRVCLGVLA